MSIIGFSSCQEEVLLDEKTELEQDQVNGEYADLEISMNAPALQVESRTLASDPKNQGGSWTNWEKFVDGALLYRVTIFVIDNNDKLVAYRNFFTGSDDIGKNGETNNGQEWIFGDNGFYEYTDDNLWSGTVNTTATTGIAVKATFSSDNPMHGSIEKLQPGIYKIIAVANYAPITDNDTGLFAESETVETYNGLGSVAEDDENNNGLGGDFTTLVNALTINNTIDGNFTGKDNIFENDGGVFSYQLNSGTDRICKLLPQPLVMIRKVTLESGQNKVSGLLSRTFARVRLEVKNNDTSTLIGVSGLSFQNNYASQNAYLFNDVAAGTSNLYDHFSLYGTEVQNEDKETTSVTGGTAGNIKVSSTDAITPASTDMKRLPAGVSNTMLDCYILEGKISAKFAFSFTASYWANAEGGAATENYRITSFYHNITTNNEGETEENYGLLEFFVYIRDAATSGNNHGNTSSGSDYILTSNTENDFSQSGTVSATTPGDVTDGTVLDPKYIWEITLKETATENNQIGVASGYLQSIGSGLYLQAYDGSTDMTPKLGDEKSEVIFKINFSSQVENGTIFSYYNEKYYYLDSNDNHVLTWVEYSGTEITTDAASGNSNQGSGNNNNNNSGGAPAYEYLAFETIPGNKGTKKDVIIQKAIGSNSTSTVTTNEIVRNDFFYGIIPISISSTSANTSTSTSGETSE